MKISVIGLGLIGASIAERLAQTYQVKGIDIDPMTIEYARSNHSTYHASLEVEEIKESDIIILALYPSQVVPWIRENQGILKPNALILDTSGVKSSIMDEVNRILRSDLEFLGFHPMAGKEKSGITYASKNLLERANIILVGEVFKPSVVDIAKDISDALGAKTLSCLSAHEHDEIIGFLSQLTHVIAICLMNTNQNPLLVNYTGDSFRDLTRIASINEYLWTELFQMNKPALLEQINLFEKELATFKDYLAQDDVEAIYTKMRESTKRRALFDK